MSKIKEENSKIYKKEVERNLDEIEKILEDVDMSSWVEGGDFKNLFDRSSRDIISSWTSGRKYSRTVFTKKAFGDTFPEDLIVFSLSIDVMINILDDLLDEELSSERKENYVIEFLRNFSIYNHENVPQELRNSVGLYLNKLITLALSESIYEKKLKQEKDFRKVVEKSVNLLECRGMDMDIFAEIALTTRHQKNVEEIKKLFRVFRALNIFKKDILDISYDMENEIDTVVILVMDKNISFIEYSDAVINKFAEKKDTISENIDDPIGEKISKMIETEEREIKKLAKSL